MSDVLETRDEMFARWDREKREAHRERVEAPHTVYLITGPGGREYVGATRSPLDIRLQGHFGVAFGQSAWVNHPASLQAAMARHGRGQFTIEALEACPDRPTAWAREKHHIVARRTLAPWGYNLRGAKASDFRDIIDLRTVKGVWPPVQSAPTLHGRAAA